MIDRDRRSGNEIVTRRVSEGAFSRSFERLPKSFPRLRVGFPTK